MKSEHIKKINNNKFPKSPEETMNDFKEYISNKTIEELEMLKHNFHTKIENSKEIEKDFIENNLREKESQILKTVNLSVTIVLFGFSVTFSLLLATILLPFFMFLPTFIITVIITNIILKKTVDVDQIVSQNFEKMVNAQRIELQKGYDTVKDTLQMNIDERIYVIDKEIKNRQENLVSPLKTETKTFDNKINVEEIKENPTKTYTKKKKF